MFWSDPGDGHWFNHLWTPTHLKTCPDVCGAWLQSVSLRPGLLTSLITDRSWGGGGRGEKGGGDYKLFSPKPPQPRRLICSSVSALWLVRWNPLGWKALVASSQIYQDHTQEQRETVTNYLLYAWINENRTPSGKPITALHTGLQGWLVGLFVFVKCSGVTNKHTPATHHWCFSLIWSRSMSVHGAFYFSSTNTMDLIF